MTKSVQAPIHAELLSALETVTAALKDIIGAAHNGEPYSAAELEGFISDCSIGEDLIAKARGEK